MTGKQSAQAEKDRAEARAKAQAEWLREHGAWNWNWPGSGADDDGPLPRNCWDTHRPVVKRHANAAKCNYTPLPGSANKRHSRRSRALAGSSYRKAN